MKRPVLIAVLCLCASLAVMFLGFHDGKVSTPTKTHTLTLLTQEDTGSFLLQLRYGAEAAANETGDKLSIVTLNPYDPASQITDLKADGVAAILLYAGDDAPVAAVTRACAEQSLPLALLGRTADGAPYAASDETLAGALAARQAKSLNAMRVIYLADRGAVSGKRLIGAMGELSDSLAAAASWYDWDGAQVLPGDVRPLAEKNAVVIALTGDATLAAVRLRGQGLLGVNNPIIGVDVSPDDVSLLEQGQAAALVLPAPYTMGYRGCGLAIAALGGRRADSVLVQPKLITLDNLYSAQNVSIAFPLLQ